jgi:hypothetical protein
MYNYVLNSFCYITISNIIWPNVWMSGDFQELKINEGYFCFSWHL